jgi:omega-6 fatty acid desaturase (delta-12 desaturase)
MGRGGERESTVTKQVSSQMDALVKLKQKEMAELATPPAGFSGLKGKALVLNKDDFPSVGEVKRVIPKHCFEKDTLTSMKYLAMSTFFLVGMALLANALVPVKLSYLPIWILYACANGTVAFGFWVIGHECGHGAFSENKTLQDAVGFVNHSFCLTPYFSWQRSHAVHHSRVNHMHEGETHVPNPTEDGFASAMHTLKEVPLVGALAHDVLAVFLVSVGFVFYLVGGASGGPAYGLSNHFWPVIPFETKLFPGKWKAKVVLSAAGVFAMLGLLRLWACKVGSHWPVLAVYGGPYLILNAWLGIVTKLHHTDTDVPHLEGEQWNWVRGAFLTIDRPYYPIVDFLQHHIGSTHVAHHLFPKIPHYHAVEATEAVKGAFPHLYLYDPTPVHWALLRICSKCVSVQKINDMWVYTTNRIIKTNSNKAD